MQNYVAVLVDGEFYLKSYCRYFKKQTENLDPNQVANALQTHCLKHVNDKRGEVLYRVFFYDCKPLTKKAHNPITNKAIDFSKSDTAVFRNAFHNELLNLPCFALRFGYLDDTNAHWQFKDNQICKQLLSKQKNINEFGENDIFYGSKQKGVDMRIGLDIATLAYKKLVSKIVLISGDSDFVPASKLARREGIHFVLDPMGNHIRVDLKEHIDWLKTTLPNFQKTS